MALSKHEFARDSPLEGNGFEPSVPREIGHVLSLRLRPLRHSKIARLLRVRAEVQCRDNSGLERKRIRAIRPYSSAGSPRALTAMFRLQLGLTFVGADLLAGLGRLLHLGLRYDWVSTNSVYW